MKKYLSYILEPGVPVWPGEPGIEITQCSSISEGDTCNTFTSVLPDHCGTHYDAPWHFNPLGPKITELPIEYFWFENVFELDLPKKAGEGVLAEDLKPWEEEIRKADLLLIRTGFSSVRHEDPEVYGHNGPYLSPEAAEYLVREFPELRTVGLDFLSVGSPANDLAEAAHRMLLGCFTEHFVTAIEDMDLSCLHEKHGKIRRVIAAPLRIAGTDSSQVCVIAEFDEE